MCLQIMQQSGAASDRNGHTQQVVPVKVVRTLANGIELRHLQLYPYVNGITMESDR